MYVRLEKCFDIQALKDDTLPEEGDGVFHFSIYEIVMSGG